MLKKQKEILERDHGHRVAYICVYGSQNYGLDINNEEYQSDVDMKAIVVPTLDDLIANSKPVSEVIDTEWGQVDVKDIRNYFEVLLKGNPAYIETLFTHYYIVDDAFKEEFSEILLLRNDLVHALRAQFIRAIYGMMMEKQKALSHPYPSIAHKIEKYGYDGKQAHHISRLHHIMLDYYGCGRSLDICLLPEQGNVEFLMNLKLNVYSLQEVKRLVETTMEMAKTYKDDVLSKIDESKIDYSVKFKFIDLSQRIIRNKIEVEIGKQFIPFAN